MNRDIDEDNKDNREIQRARQEEKSRLAFKNLFKVF